MRPRILCNLAESRPILLSHFLQSLHMTLLVAFEEGEGFGVGETGTGVEKVPLLETTQKIGRREHLIGGL